jgi:hypothetical protein
MEPIESLSWLSGNWEDKREDVIFEEAWLPPRGGTICGISRTVKEGKTTFEEYGRIGPTDIGLALTTVHGLGKPVLVYKAIEFDESHVVFGNEDDPAKVRIAYFKEGPGLGAVVTGVREGKDWELRFQFSRPEEPFA